MNWLPNDKATWGIVLAIVAITLAFPLSLLGNLVTPKFRNWWAQRSVTAVRERITKLERQLKRLEVYDVLPESEEIVMLTLLRAGRAMGSVVGFVFGVAAFMAFHHSHHYLRSAVGVLVLGLFGMITSVTIGTYIFGPATICWKLRSCEARDKIRRDILRLSVKLAGPR